MGARLREEGVDGQTEMMEEEEGNREDDVAAVKER